MKKLLLILTLGLFLTSFASALEFDNVLNYDETTQTAKIINAFDLPLIRSDIGEVTLDTPLNVKVPIGYQQVGELPISSYKDYKDVIKSFEFINMKNGEKINRNIDLKIKEIVEVEVEDYEYKIIGYEENRTEIYNYTFVGTHKENRTNWIPIKDNKLDMKEFETLTIGIFTDVQKGDYVDWIPTIYGVKISQWATWEASFEVGLIRYYSMNETSGNMTDYSPYNLGLAVTGTGNRGQPAIFTNTNYSLNTTANTQYAKTNSPLSQGSNDITVCFATKLNSWSQIGHFIKTGDGANMRPFAIYQAGWDDGNSTLALTFGDAVDPLFSTAPLAMNTAYHICATYNESVVMLYINGVYNQSISKTTNMVWGGDFEVGTRDAGQFGTNALISDVAVWNITQSSSAISTLWNSGDICTPFSCTTAPENNITLNNPSNQSNNFETITNVSLITGLNSTCQYSTNESFVYGDGTNMSSNQTLHWFEINNDIDLTKHQYSFICQNNGTNTSLSNLVFNAMNVTKSLVIGGYGDSIMQQSALGLDSITYVSTNLSANDIWGITGDNDGKDGSCLATSCAGHDALIDEFQTTMIAQNELIVLLEPYLNDIANGVTALEYRTAFEQIVKNATNNASILMTFSPQPVVEPTYNNNLSYQYSVGVREIAVLNELPFLEWAYINNWNSTYTYDGTHLNQAGANNFSESIYDLYKNRDSKYYTTSNWSYYGFCNYTAELLNKSIKMNNSANCEESTSADWLVINSIKDSSFYITRADEGFQYNITNLEENILYNITLSNGTFYNKSTTYSGVLELEFSALTGLGVSYNTLGLSPPTVTLNIPTPYQNITTTNINFSCYVKDDNQVSNVTLFLNGIANETNTSGINNTNYTFNKILPVGDYNWTCRATNNFTTSTYASTRFFRVDLVPEIVLNYPTALLNYSKVNETLQLNFTTTDIGLDKVWYNYNGTNITIAGATSGVYNISNITLSTKKNVTIYANDTTGNLNTSVFSWDYKVFENSRTYSETTISGAGEQFKVNITYNSLYSGINVLLNYNGSNYTMSSSNTGFNKEYVYNITIPSVATESNITSYFIYILSNSTETNQINSDSFNQTINPFLIDNCSTYTNTLLNFYMVDEDSLNEINGTIEVNVNIYSYGTTDLVNSYNASFNYSTTTDSKICLQNITQDYTMSYQIRHYGDVSEYFPKYRNIQRMTINNETISQNITLYNLNLTRGYAFNVIVVGNLLSSMGNRGLLVDSQRQYLSLDEFKSIETSITNADGIAVSHLVQTSEIYNFLVSYNGELLGTFNNYQVQCSNAPLGQCSITLNLAQATGTAPDFDNYGNVTQLLTLDNDTHILYHTFSSTDGSSKDFISLITKMDGYGNTTICNNSAVGTSGTLICSIPTIYQNSTFLVQTIVDGELIGTETFSQGVDQNWYGVNTIIILLGFSSFVLLFVGHPITIVMGAVLGMLFPVLLVSMAGLSFATIVGSLAYWIASGIIIFIVIRRKM